MTARVGTVIFWCAISTAIIWIGYNSISGGATEIITAGIFALAISIIGWSLRRILLGVRSPDE